MSTAALRPASRGSPTASLSCPLPSTPLPPSKSRKNQDKNSGLKDEGLREREGVVSLNTLSPSRPARQGGPGEGPALSLPLIGVIRAPGAERAGQAWKPGGHLPRPRDRHCTHPLIPGLLTDGPGFPSSLPKARDWRAELWA